jgi:hypothetical protein
MRPVLQKRLDLLEKVSAARMAQRSRVQKTTRKTLRLHRGIEKRPATPIAHGRDAARGSCGESAGVTSAIVGEGLWHREAVQ